MSKKRILSYDVIRIVAIFAVVMVHVVSIYLRRAPVDSVEFITANVWGSLARIGVPMFVMLSGALLLNEERSYSYKTMAHQANAINRTIYCTRAAIVNRIRQHVIPNP